MSVREYIGARYVPIFANPIEWHKKNEYEPLTIVTNEGNSYTSRQYVPAGISIDNEDYWAITGNYNAQIEQYRKEVSEIAEKMESFDGIVTPELYGAAGDGVTDDTDAVKSAVASGKNVLLIGKYLCSSDISIPSANNLCITGINTIKSGLMMASGSRVVIGTDNTRQNEVRLNNFTIEGDRTQTRLLIIKYITNVYMQSVCLEGSNEYLMELNHSDIVFIDSCIFAGSNDSDVWMPCKGLLLNNSEPVRISNSNIWNLSVFCDVIGLTRTLEMRSNWIEFVGTVCKYDNVPINTAFCKLLDNSIAYPIHGNIQFMDYAMVTVMNITGLNSMNVEAIRNHVVCYPDNHFKSVLDVSNVDNSINAVIEDNTFFTTLTDMNIYAVTGESVNLRYRSSTMTDADRGSSDANVVVKSSPSIVSTANLNLSGDSVPDASKQNGHLWYADWLYLKNNGTVRSVAVSNGETITDLQSGASLEDVIAKVNALFAILRRSRLVSNN